jgi:hypothetical protein
MGMSPDGMTRVTRERTYLLLDGSATGSNIERRTWGLKRNKAFTAERLGYLLVILQDGRAGYTGDLNSWHRYIAEAIAAGSSWPLLRSSSDDRWLFE